MALLSFIVPVRHQLNSSNWGALKQRLGETISSVSGQLHDDWEALIVANVEADLPTLPSPHWSIVRVNFPPNPTYDLSGDRSSAYKAVRLDKGRRVLSGAIRSSGQYIMVVDDDDFISNRIVSYVSEEIGVPGWRIDEGFLWSDGTHLLYRDRSFSKICGTSHIIRRDLLSLPASLDQAGNNYVSEMLGSHVYIDNVLKRQATPLQPLPFAGAIYRMGHSGAHSKSKSVIRSQIINRKNLMSPVDLISSLARLKLIDLKIRNEFGI